MKYYLIRNSTNIGQVYPHGHCVDRNINLVELEAKAILTDLLSVTNYYIDYELALRESAILLLKEFWNGEGINSKRIVFANKTVEIPII